MQDISEHRRCYLEPRLRTPTIIAGKTQCSTMSFVPSSADLRRALTCRICGTTIMVAATDSREQPQNTDQQTMQATSCYTFAGCTTSTTAPQTIQHCCKAVGWPNSNDQAQHLLKFRHCCSGRSQASVQAARMTISRGDVMFQTTPPFAETGPGDRPW